MRNDLADITVVIDRSGSMAQCQSDAQGGLNTFVDQQRRLEGDCLFTLVEFDQEYNFVCNGIPISQVAPYTLVPRGTTALLDAVGQAINQTGERLSKMQEGDRPGLVIFAIITDGQENSSKEFTKAQIKEMIERQTKDYNWQFTFLGANQDAFAEASSIGIQASAAASYAVADTRSAFNSVTSNVERMRYSARSGAAVKNEFTDSERSAMGSSKK